MSDGTLAIGKSAEDVACQHLQAAGCKLKQRNFRCKTGEIDLIINDGEDIAFVEVRYRGKENFGSGAETVSPAKQRKIIKAAKYYMRIGKIHYLTPCRFDVVSITLENNKPKIDWIKNAFQAETF